MNTTPVTPDGPLPDGPVVAVRTTRIYCRPVCRPARMPKPENCIAMPSAQAARAAGYRPCKLCRPDDPTPPERVRKQERLPRSVRYGVGASAVGTMFVALSERGVCLLYLLADDDPSPGLDRLRSDFPHAELREDPEAVAPFIERVNAAIRDGEPVDDLPLDLHGTPFQQRVWSALRAIPRGSTCSYGELARRLGLPAGSARAVGAACGANPVAVLVPCHRVLASTGQLRGYRGGLAFKRALLDHERTGAGMLSFR